MKKTLTILAAVILLTAGAAYAQSSEDASQEQIDAALQDLSAIYGSPVVRADQARAICNQEQYMLECADIGKKHGLFPEAREKEVDAILTEFKGQVIEDLKQCGNTECLITVATKIARELSVENPTLARSVDLTPQKVEEKRSIVATAKEIGVDFDECRAMDPDTASVELLRACARLAKHENIQQYIPEEDRGHIEKTENSAALKEALAKGELACGDGTLEGCGTFCLNPSASAREEGPTTIPAVCRQIAEQFFGDDGVEELERTYQNVRDTYDEAKKIYTEKYPSRRGSEPDPILFYPEGTTTPRTICPAVDPLPCPPGEYRQESVNELGCYTFGACIPFNTQTQKEPDVKDHYICPALPTVDSCRDGEEKVVSFTSPECGTYYTCQPKPEERSTKFPYAFTSGRVVLSFDEARIYCYESGSGGATARGDKAECLNAFGITVPDIPPEKQCVEYGSGWHSMDSSGNCFNPSMTEYRTPGGVLQICANVPVYGCTSTEEQVPPSGQKEQVWNSLGLRSWIRSDASESRIAELKAACVGTPSSANIWLSGAGTYSSVDFGMPDPGKCKKAAACKAGEYFNGSECSGDNSSKPQCSDGKDNDNDGKIDYPSDTGCSSANDWDEVWQSTGDGCGSLTSESSCKAKADCSWTVNTSYYGGYCALTSTIWTPQCSDGKDNDGDGKADYPTDSGCNSKTDDLEQDNVGGESGMRHCFYLNATIDGKYPGYSVWCEADYYNCHVGEPSGASVSLSGLTLGTPSSCESGWSGGTGSTSTTASQGDANSCPSFAYSRWDSRGARYCQLNTQTSCQYFYPQYMSESNYSPSSCPTDTSNTDNVSGSCSSELLGLLGGGCHTMGNAWFNSGMTEYVMPGTQTVRSCSTEYVSGCTSGSTGTTSCPSGQYWSGTTCVTYDTSPSTTSCPSGQYWDTPTNSCKDNVSACAEAGGSWDSAANYCVMPGTSTGVSPSTTSCPSGQYWDGATCVSSQTSTTDYSSAQAGCASAGGTWDSGANYCRMPTSSISKPLAYLCPSGHEWNGSYCTLADKASVQGFLASVFSAFASLFGW